MKLAEALLLRAEYQKKLAGLQGRLLANLRVQEKEKPHEDPNKLLEEATQLNDQLTTLVKQINRQNHRTKMAAGGSLADALADRDGLLKKRSLLADLAAKASERDYRLTHTEVKTFVTVSVGDLQKQVDALSHQFRLLDTEIQGLNWVTELEPL